MKQHKNYIVLIIILLIQLHVLFRGVDQKINLFIATDREVWLTFYVFCVGVFVRFFLSYYLLLKPYSVNKYLKHYLFILSFLDLLHFVFNSAQGYSLEKILLGLFCLGVIKLINYVKFNYSIL